MCSPSEVVTIQSSPYSAQAPVFFPGVSVSRKHKSKNALVMEGDCRAVMRRLAPNSVSAIVTDPPYGLQFMGHGWDRNVPGIESEGE